MKRAIPWLLGCIAASGLIFAFVPWPFLWLFWGWFAFCLVYTRQNYSTPVRIVSINLATLLCLFGIAEVYFLFEAEPWAEKTEVSAQERVEAENLGDSKLAKPAGAAPGEVRVDYLASLGKYIEFKDYLGYGPLPNNVVSARRYEGPKLVYDVVYTYDQHGLRITPEYEGDGEHECILFFGGSFTLGEGAHDDEAMPHVVGVQTAKRFRVHNFGFHGYGPHQMLAALEHGIIDDVLQCTPKYVFYQAINAHIKRSAGVRLAILDRHAPRYRLRKDGTVIFDGHYDEASNAPQDTIIRRSSAYRVFSGSFFLKELHYFAVMVSEHIDLLVAIASQSRRIVERRWPGSEFHIIFWNERIQTKSKRLEWALEDKQFRMHKVGDIIPDYLSNQRKYQITELDHHPNADAHRQIANYLVRNVIDRPNSAE